MSFDATFDPEAPVRRRRLVARWPALAAVAICLPLAVIAVVGSLYWPGRTFPGFLVMGNRMVPTIGLYSWTGTAADVPFHAEVQAVDGRPIAGSDEAYAAAAATTPGTPLVWTFRKQDDAWNVRVPTMRFGAADYWLTVGLFVAFGLVSVAAGIGVFVLQPHTPQATAFLLFGVLTGLFALTGSALYHPGLWWMIEPHVLAQALFPAAFIHLGLVFPVPRRAVLRHPWLLWTPYIVGIGLAAWVFRDFFAEPPDPTPLYATYVYSAAGIVTLLGLLTWSYVERRTPDVRTQLRSVLPGLLIGTVIGLYGFLDNARGGGVFPINLIALTPFVFFLAIAYAIARHDLFDIDTIVKRAVVYGVLSLGIAGAYAGAVALANGVRPDAGDVEGPTFTMAFVLVAALLFNPVRALLQAAADRVFHRGRPDYRRTVAEVSADLTSLLHQDEILDRVGRTVSDGLQVRTLVVLLWADAVTVTRRFDRLLGAMAPGPDGSWDAIRNRLSRDPGHAWLCRGDAADPADAEVMALDGTLVVPMQLRGQLLGAFVLGRPLSGRLFGREDVDLLRTLAAQSAIAIGNARSYQGLERSNADLEAKVAARTAALAGAYDALKTAQTQLVHSEKMAALGVLVAGVAHEINNPVSFIVGGVAPLREVVDDLRVFADEHPAAGLGGAVERAGRSVEAIARGAERTAGIVRDLRTFSRVGDAGPRPVDLQDGLEVSLRLLQPRWANRIVIHRAFDVVPAIEGEPDELNQVWMNLLGNACDAIVGPGNLWITTRSTGEVVEVVVRDDGAGIAADVLGRIFDPFFTTKRQGQGTGLGLAISHGIVARHGGRIQVESQPGVGTTFIVTLPVRRAPGDQRVAS